MAGSIPGFASGRCDVGCCGRYQWDDRRLTIDHGGTDGTLANSDPQQFENLTGKSFFTVDKDLKKERNEIYRNKI